MKAFLAILGLVVLVLVGSYANTAMEKSKLRKPLLSKLTDPESAQFRNEELVKAQLFNKTVLCGEVNAKNRMGGYVGFQKFHSDGETAMVGDSDFAIKFIDDHLCKPASAKN